MDIEYNNFIMKNFILAIVILSFLSCVGSDTSYFPQNISEARKRNLLIAEFESSTKLVYVNKTQYSLEEVFLTSKFNSKKDKTINQNIFALVVVIRNLNTGEYGLSAQDYSNFEKYIKFNCKTCGGIIDNNIVLLYEDLRNSNKVDSAKILIIKNKDNRQIVKFTKVQKR